MEINVCVGVYAMCHLRNRILNAFVLKDRRDKKAVKLVYPDFDSACLYDDIIM